jgi:HEAT repeat protein
VLLLEHPGARKDAALELVKRADPELLDTIMGAMRKMPRAEVVRVAAALVSFGEESGDGFIDGLEARKTFVRHAAALALGHLKLRRAVVPLVHRLQVEPSDVWLEVARVLGSFGKGAFRTLARGIKDPKEHGDRMAYALAHLALNGCEAQVEELTRDRDKALAMLALEGLRRRKEAADQLAKVAGERPIDGDDQLLEFAASFYVELRKATSAVQ